MAEAPVSKGLGQQKLVWISTRRGEPVADTIASNVVGRYLLASIISEQIAPFREFMSVDTVVMEVPPVAKPKFEHQMLNIVQRIRAAGPTVLLIVQPSLRRKSNKTLWVHKWSSMAEAPFRFGQTCSCKTGNKLPGCHLTCLIGCSQEMQLTACTEVPTIAATSAAAVSSLGATVKYVAGCLSVIKHDRTDAMAVDVESAPQQVLDSTLAPEKLKDETPSELRPAVAFPIGAKEKEKAKRAGKGGRNRARC